MIDQETNSNHEELTMEINTKMLTDRPEDTKAQQQCVARNYMLGMSIETHPTLPIDMIVVVFERVGKKSN